LPDCRRQAAFLLNDTVTMDHYIHVIRGFEQLAIQLCLTLCTVSPLARMAWRELKRWQSPAKNRKPLPKTTR
jgi:hypothetical protein